MKHYSLDEILRLIENGDKFEGLCFEAGMHLKINEYKSKIAIAIGGGSNFSEDLEPKAKVMSFDRWQYEDAYTDYFIKDGNLSLLALDSKFEYDLNKNVKDSFYDKVGDKEAWNEDVSDEEKEKSFAKHRNFYLVLDAIINKLEEKHSKINLYSFHSFNYKNTNENLPLFDLGTKFLDKDKVEEEYDRIYNLLKTVSDREAERVEENRVSKGDGYFYEYLKDKHPKVNAFSINIKKVFCNEEDGEVYGDKMVEIKEVINNIID